MKVYDLTEDEIDQCCAGCEFSQRARGCLEGPSDCEECNSCTTLRDWQEGKYEWCKEHGLVVE